MNGGLPGSVPSSRDSGRRIPATVGRCESLRTPRSERSRINAASQAAWTHFSALRGLSAALRAHADGGRGPSQDSAAALAEGAARSAGILGCPHAFGGVSAQEAGGGVPGAGGVCQWHDPSQVRTLRNPRVWLDAATQIFFSLSLAFGGHIAFASYNPPR